jgi:hypothetical protein
VIPKNGEGRGHGREAAERPHIFARVEIMPEGDEVSGEADQIGRLIEAQRNGILDQGQGHNKRGVQIGKVQQAKGSAHGNAREPHLAFGNFQPPGLAEAWVAYSGRTHTDRSHHQASPRYLHDIPKYYVTT